MQTPKRRFWVALNTRIAAIDKIKCSAIIAFDYKYELVRLKEEYPDSVDFSKGDPVEIIDRWNVGRIKKLLIHPTSAAHSSNLHFGSAMIIWFTLNRTLEQYNQANINIWKMSKEPPVEICHFIVSDTPDTIVKAVLESKDSRQQSLLAAMEQYRK